MSSRSSHESHPVSDLFLVAALAVGVGAFVVDAGGIRTTTESRIDQLFGTPPSQDAVLAAPAQTTIETTVPPPLEAPLVPAQQTPLPDLDLARIAGFNGYTIPCEGAPRSVIRKTPDWTSADWSGIQDSGIIGTNSAGEPIHFYIRQACDTQNIETSLIISSIHGTENGGQFVGHELLFNASLPSNMRVIVVPELNEWGIDNGQRKNFNGVDLNRNSFYDWEQLNGEELDVSSRFYRGPSAGSEPETAAITNFLSTLGTVDLALFYHDKLGYVAPVGNTPPVIAFTYGSYTGLGIGIEKKTEQPDINSDEAKNAWITVKGSLDAWYNQATGSPALLIEMTEDQSDPVIQQHVGAVVQTLNEIN